MWHLLARYYQALHKRLTAKNSEIVEVLQPNMKQNNLLSVENETSLFTSIFENAAIGMALLSVTGKWLKTNSSLSQIVGYSAEQLATIDFQTITYPDDLNSDLALLNELIQGERVNYHMEKRYIHKEGHLIWVLLSVSLIKDRNGIPCYLVAQIQDITSRKTAEHQLLEKQKQLKNAQSKLIELANHDVLTGLANRQKFGSYFKSIMPILKRQNGIVSFAMIDIDYFKSYNDSYGHLAGDEALRKVALTLKEELREVDLLARYGGEEFVVLLPHTDLEGCMSVCERLRLSVSRLGGLKRDMAVSIGCMTYHASHIEEIPTQDELLHRADLALYRAKTDGRNCVRHYENIKTESELMSV